jgi:hypothetical protein
MQIEIRHEMIVLFLCRSPDISPDAGKARENMVRLWPPIEIGIEIEIEIAIYLKNAPPTHKKAPRHRCPIVPGERDFVMKNPLPMETRTSISIAISISISMKRYREILTMRFIHAPCF